MGKTKVLFVCPHGAARGPMAAAFLRAYGGESYEAYSAGVTPREIEPLTVEVMQERGIDISGERARGLNEYLGREHFGILITLYHPAEPEHPIFPGVGTRLQWIFEDPGEVEGGEEQRLAKLREVRDAIELRVRGWLAERAAQPGPAPSSDVS